MTAMIPTLINGRWTLLLPEHRSARPSWPWWEATRLAAMNHFIKPGDVVYDIGAEEGDFPALWSQWGADVVLVEPNPKVWPNIKAIWEANLLPPPLGWWVGFLGNERSLPTDFDYDAREHASWLTENPWPVCASGEVIGNHGHRHLLEETDTTPSITLDMLAYDVGRPPTVITMDCEGSEFRILKGAAHVLIEYRPLVFCSVHPQFMLDMYRDDPDSLYDYMDQLRYERVFLTEDHERHEMFVPKERMWPR